jgi:glycosyltransferase involved in cell wall biosynthesis
LTKPKRLEWLLDLAERCPDADFDVLGAANTESDYAKKVVERAGTIPNVFMRGRVLHAEMGGFYRKADLLCSTSVYEGFPNVYLEAWSLGIPLVTTFDPDDVVKTYGHGRVATDVDGLAAAVAELSESGTWNVASEAARSYFLEFHQVKVAMCAFKEEFLELRTNLGKA